MTWRTVAASEVGTAHTAVGGDCEDTCWALVEGEGSAAGPLLSAFAADGAGSAACGRLGAELAVEAGAAVARRLSELDEQVDESHLRSAMAAARQAILERAAAEGRAPRDYACTFLALMARGGKTVALQIGDGALVVDIGQGLVVAVAPMSGEYANMTRFVTDDDAENWAVTRTYEARLKRAAILTDGLQRLSINLQDNTPHEGFFAPLFAALEQARGADEDALIDALKRFLGSEPINQRTDDDKTLVLATWIG